ncbi:MAG: Ig-like domain-containing protein, partial [Leptospiraceae bacterium]|nr:Ig-like domain-containing protein [Leptospiraceae bacterium]
SFIAGGTTPFNPLLSMNTNFGTLAACNAGTGVLNDFLANPTLTNGCLGNPTTNPIVINFSFPMDPIPTQSALTISPSISGTFAWTVGNTVLTFTPDSKLNYGTRYTVTLGALAKTSNGIPVSSSTSTSFVVGSVITSPAVQAFGVSSQGCSATFPGIGSAIGANWASPTCYWDSSLAIQTPSFYTFRAGDTGSGSTGSPLSCADANTDNFKIIFNSYMDLNSTVNAVRLRRLSPPTTSIQLASWQWTDCQGTFPFGCRVLTVVFAEQEASCNGTLFGNAATGGDFNLLRTDNMPVGSPFYLLSVDTTAKDTSGVSLPSTFNFSMEGK